jgi:hypothetical protein
VTTGCQDDAVEAFEFLWTCLDCGTTSRPRGPVSSSEDAGRPLRTQKKKTQNEVESRVGLKMEDGIEGVDLKSTTQDAAALD